MHAYLNYPSGSVLVGTQSKKGIRNRLSIIKKVSKTKQTPGDNLGSFGNSTLVCIDFTLQYNILGVTNLQN